MKEDRKAIILKEIHFWKTHKMLPEHYCDYLIALYSEGETTPEKNKSKKQVNIEMIFSFIFLLLIFTMILITYINVISFGMQTLVTILFFVFLASSYLYFRKKQLNTIIIFITSAFIFLLYTVLFNNFIFDGRTISLYLLLIVNCIIWIAGGIRTKKRFFVISGTIAIIVLIIVSILNII